MSGEAKTSAEVAEPGGAMAPWRLCVLALALALPATLAARGLLGLIGFFTTHLLGDVATAPWWRLLLAPALGGLGVGLIARFGARAVIGHGIPEVMQQVLSNRSRIAPRVALLKPIASAVSIGSGGPFGAEGPVIALGGSVGSLIGQGLSTTPHERKTLLAAGAAAGMTAVFGTPLAATLLAIELLLFEFRPRSALPVALAAVGAQGLRLATGHAHVEFFTPDTGAVGLGALAFCALLGAAGGALAVLATRGVHAMEAVAERCPLPWFIRPALGGLVVGGIACLVPRVLGPGYGEIDALLAGKLALGAAVLLCGAKLIAWVLALGGGTSGGTLAPMLVIGGALGAAAGRFAELAGASWAPSPGLAALAGMAAFFAGGSRALFATVALGVEMTGAFGALAPVLGSALAASLVAHALARHSLMSGPVEQNGVRVPRGFSADAFARITVGEAMVPSPPALAPTTPVRELADRLGAHDPALSHYQAFMLVDAEGRLRGLVTRRDVLAAVERGELDLALIDAGARELTTAFPDETLDVVLERLHARGVGRAPVVDRANPTRLLGYLGRTAVLAARHRHQDAEHRRESGWWRAGPRGLT